MIILPHMELSAVYNAFNLTDVNNPTGPFNPTNITNSTAMQIQVSERHR